jgi:hypothetical protein
VQKNFIDASPEFQALLSSFTVYLISYATVMAGIAPTLAREFSEPIAWRVQRQKRQGGAVIGI